MHLCPRPTIDKGRQDSCHAMDIRCTVGPSITHRKTAQGASYLATEDGVSLNCIQGISQWNTYNRPVRNVVDNVPWQVVRVKER